VSADVAESEADRDTVPGMVSVFRHRVRLDGKFFARGGERLRIRGVTYGPFAPNGSGEPFLTRDRTADDFERMHDLGINTVRTYHVPPEWFLSLADERGMNVFVDIPWPKHLCFLDSARAQKETREVVSEAARRGRDHPCVLAYSLGNEIPPSVVRWHGTGRIERFLLELLDTARQADPSGLFTYASYPPTEYLELSFLDFATFNVYLHDREAFRRYLLRLQNLVGDRPLLLGELGMDTLRHGEREQADFLAGHLREALLLGLAGAFVFAWTDEWYTGGYAIEDWAFGITRRDRSPKAAAHALREVFEPTPAALLPATPRVSVVVCTYNGGRTLDQCLRSLLALDYPDFEVIVVDDGSTDDTPSILARFPDVRVIRQPNNGLSVARNVGLEAATGEIVAYTDSDCYADSDWLTHLVHQLVRTGAAAAGGPNLSPEDGWLAACVAASPGQPTHVLESDQVAEHIPGCNMAFRRDALLAIGGFDPQFRKAGDDVDVCWRIQEAGMWITFAPGAFVWHHRRQTPRAYLRQQAGYGEAEAMLRFKHPDKFNGRGDGKWRGSLYGASLQGIRVGSPIVHRGTFGTGLFQCLYQPAPAHWAMLPSTLEWHAGALLILLAALFWGPPLVVGGVLLGLSILVAVLQATQARLAPEHEGFCSRLLIAALCYAQPLVRSWRRYRTRFFSFPALAGGGGSSGAGQLPLFGTWTTAYWSEEWRERTELLDRVVGYLSEHRWGKVIDPGWSDWDLEVHCHPWTILQVCTAEEDHGGAKRLIRVRYRLRLTHFTRMLLGLGAVVAGLVAIHSASAAVTALALLAVLLVGVWWRGRELGARAAAVFDEVADRLGLLRRQPSENLDPPEREEGATADEQPAPAAPPAVLGTAIQERA
jgi:GT2 family glycosyltransferase